MLQVAANRQIHQDSQMGMSKNWLYLYSNKQFLYRKSWDKPWDLRLPHFWTIQNISPLNHGCPWLSTGWLVFQGVTLIKWRIFIIIDNIIIYYYSSIRLCYLWLRIYTDNNDSCSWYAAKSGLVISPKDMIDRPANPNLFWNNHEELETWNLCEILG